MQAYQPRTLEKTLRQAAAQFPALILTGPRQSGKTTLLQHLFSRTHRYVSLDDPDARLQAGQDPRYFLENHPPPVMIDEIQYAPGLFPLLKIHIDRHRDRMGQFLLTGSQAFPLMAGVGESLAGRVAVLSLLSLSLKEEFGGQVLSLTRFKERVLRGGYPDLALSRKRNARLWHTGYLQTYLERDVRQLRRIGDLTDFQRFLQLLAAHNGQIIHLSNLSNDLGVAVNTVKNWISILEASQQILLIKPYYRNKGKRLVKSPKVYFLDTGFLNYLNGMETREQVFKGPLSGALMETVVAGEILRDYYGRGDVPRIYWWRTSYGEEVDFVLEQKGQLIAVEVKLSTQNNTDAIRGLQAFSRLFGEQVTAGYLVNLSEESVRLGPKISAFPYTLLTRKSLLNS